LGDLEKKYAAKLISNNIHPPRLETDRPIKSALSSIIVEDFDNSNFAPNEACGLSIANLLELMLRIALGLIILLLQFHWAKASNSCYSAHRKVQIIEHENSVLIEATDSRWAGIAQRTVSRFNRLLGSFAVKNFKLRISSEENAFSSGHQSKEIRIGVKGDLLLTDFKSITAHELGHEVFEQYFKVELDGQTDSFQNHRQATRERETDSEQLLNLIETKSRTYQVYHELLGDIFAAYFVKDPHAIPNALNHSFQKLSESERAEVLDITPLALDFIQVRSLDLPADRKPLMVPLSMLEQMRGRLVHYQMLNKVRTKIWRQILAHLKPEDFPKFVEAYLQTVSSHRQIHRHVHFKFFDEFNQSFWDLLVQNLQQRNIPLH